MSHPHRSRRVSAWLTCLVGTALLVPSAGCRLCCDDGDLSYPAYGGAWQRTRRDDGRVGSLFDPAGGRQAQLTSRDVPRSVDELYRSTQSGSDPAVDEDPGAEAKPELDADSELERRAREMENLNLQDINVVPGSPAPPDMS